jgi:hypothetical protein
MRASALSWTGGACEQIAEENEREEKIGEWTIIHSEEFLDLHSEPEVIRVIKLRKIRWPEHAARI